jgi:hypothetical protein
MAKQKGKVASAAYIGAINFKPLSAKELEELKPPSNGQWIKHLAMLRVAWMLLGKSKDELKEVVRKSEANEVDLFEDFRMSMDFL